jgi:hypothetical protein
MTTEDIIKDLRYLCDQPAYAGVSETMTLAANAIEGLGLRFDECMQKHNDTRAELERLKIELAQAISERTPHDYGLLKYTIESLKEELHASREELAKVKQESVKTVTVSFPGMPRSGGGGGGSACGNNHLPDAGKMVRPEPSRLEIAAMLLSGFAASDTSVIHNKYNFVLKEADALIAAAKEGQ